MSKKYEELNFTDDFFFCKILMKNKRLCKELLELILQIKIVKIVFTMEQKPIEITADGKGVRLDISEEMRDFLEYLQGKGTKSDFTRRIEEEVTKARAHEEWRVEYMSLFLRDQEMREEGREEGRKEGCEEKKRAVVMNMLKENEPIEKICRYAECDEHFVEEVKKEL